MVELVPFLVLVQAQAQALNLDAVGNKGDEKERLGLGIDSVYEKSFVHRLLLAHLEHGGEGAVGCVDDDKEDGDLFWEDPDSDPYCVYLLPAFNTTLLY
ncbi:unnamed protein product [Vicia faba]|uniref:Uncharacterized protein n=1 Tax=Vicia faba TaxID=3906 RepID=A0AAV0YHX8_VICFA|nr:unnamed protein product [Vicia faba]